MEYMPSKPKIASPEAETYGLQHKTWPGIRTTMRESLFSNSIEKCVSLEFYLCKCVKVCYHY